MFKDKIYEDMDDISKLVEPFESGINNELSKFPDEIELTSENILSGHTNWGWRSINTSDMISNQAIKLGLSLIADQSWNLSREFFKFEVRDLEEEEVVGADFATKKLSHKIFLVKKKIGYDDLELEASSRAQINSTIRNALYNNKQVNKPRLNELADLYGAKSVASDRSYRGKVHKFCNHLQDMIKSKKLDIRNTDLCDKFAGWVVLWVRDGNLPALNNLTRIKIITHENRPIYSIEEKDCK